MKALNVFIVALAPGPAAWAKARTGGKPAVTAAAAVMRRTLRRDGIETFTGPEKMPVERISDQDASPNRHRQGNTCRAGPSPHWIGLLRNRSRNLRCDQESREHRRHADESQELINGKHRPHPPKERDSSARLIRPLRGHLLAGQKLVAIGRPGNREQRENADNGQRFHGFHGHFRLWPKASAFRPFSGRSRET
jgi:hypothetical protein